MRGVACSCSFEEPEQEKQAPAWVREYEGEGGDFHIVALGSPGEGGLSRVYLCTTNPPPPLPAPLGEAAAEEWGAASRVQS